MKDNRSSKHGFAGLAQLAVRTLAVGLAVVAFSGLAFANDKEDKKEEVTFKFFPAAAFVDCLRANPYEEPRARATVIRGKDNDTMILDLDGVKPGLKLSGFSLQRTILLADGSKDPNAKGFGLSWYQTEIETGKRSDDGHVRIKTVLLDEPFGFDPDVALPPTNTFHFGFWFDDPKDAVACGFDPLKTTPFNGEHKAGPLAFVTVPDAGTGLGPLCTEADKSTTPATCKL